MSRVGQNVPAESLLLRLWGKADRGDVARWHPLLFHMLDAGNVAACILKQSEDHPLRDLLRSGADADPEALGSLLAFLVGLHDLGKAAPAFQRLARDWGGLRQAGFEDDPRRAFAKGFRHDVEAVHALPAVLTRSGVLADRGGDASRFSRAVAQAVGAHHGEFIAGRAPAYPEVSAAPSDPDHPFSRWAEAREELLALARSHFLGGTAVTISTPNLSAFVMLLNGLTILSDWIASSGRWFPFAGGTELAVYRGLSRERAHRAVAELGLLSFLPVAQPSTYAQLFPARPEARPLQRALEPHELPALPPQSLILIEAPTGEGKTEAALLLAARLAVEGRPRGLYFALPTVATSNQMYDRVRAFLGEHSPAILINGLAELSEQLDTALAEIPDRPQEVISDNTRAHLDPWFLPRKRSLLAPYGVGTIDQAMVGALNVRHGSLRLLGLSGKVVVVDEVHAYDLYMSTIILRLLSWLRALGTNVILLSATLPTSKRRELIAAYAGADASFVPAAAYPLVTIVPADGEPQSLEPAASCGSRTVLLERRPDGASERTQNAAWLLDQVRNGGCACWICNTVKEAQACYLELRDQVARRQDQPAPELLLFHARFPVARRQQTEMDVLGRFGPDGVRPERTILVATQVVEQSLDLDFDLIVTQLCPADLLLQRIGRLQRHQRPARSLDAGRPRCVILLPPATGAGPEFGDYSYVYSPFVLLKTMLALHGRASLHIPENVRALVDAVYDDTVPSTEQAAAAGLSLSLVDEAKRAHDREQARFAQEAKIRLLGCPDPEGTFYAQPDLRVMDDEIVERDDWAAAQTRLSDPSVRVALLKHDHPLLRPDSVVFDPKASLDRDLVRQLLRLSLAIGDRSFVKHALQKLDSPPAFRRSAALREYLLVPLDEDGGYSWEEGGRSRRLQLSDELGVHFLDPKEVRKCRKMTCISTC